MSANIGSGADDAGRELAVIAPLQGQDTVIVVVMEFCDLGSLLRAVHKKAFKPHGKWSYHTTYVSQAHQTCYTCASSLKQLLGHASVPTPVCVLACSLQLYVVMHDQHLWLITSSRSEQMLFHRMLCGLICLLSICPPWSTFSCCYSTTCRACDLQMHTSVLVVFEVPGLMTAMLSQPRTAFAWLLQQIPDQLSCIPQ